MEIKKVIAELQQELARIDEAIQTLERLEKGLPRRGRPPGWLSLAGGAAPLPERKMRKKQANKSAQL